MLLATAWISLVTAVGCALGVVADLARGNRQSMWIMNIVWPVTALWSGPAGLWFYVRYGRTRAAPKTAGTENHHHYPPTRRQPFGVLVAKATTHCGGGCTLGDLAAESLAALLPLVLFGQAIFGAWVYDFVLAYLIGVAFQYFTITPMRRLSRRRGLVEAIKADTLSLGAWQVGMYGWMALVRFVIVGHDLPKNGPVFWFMMQIAMFFGFATSYPVNWWLLRRGIKEAM